MWWNLFLQLSCRGWEIEEVLEQGDEEQKAEAKSILESMA